MRKIYFVFLIFPLFHLPFAICHATNWLVGPSKTYTKPSQVSSLVQPGDTVSIDAGTYASDVCVWTAANLLLRGVGGYAHLESNGLSYGDKAIWVIQGANTRVEWIEFSECTSTSQNGAGIRQEAAHLTVRHCYFHNNENGILAGTINPSNIRVEFTEFGYNGAGDGYSHNLYINHVDTLFFRFNYSHHANIGHELKSRAHVNIIMYNRFSNESTGNASREVDLPDGGTSILIGNVIEQGPNSVNSGIIGYGLESTTNNPPHEFYLINNTVVNNRTTGTFVSIPAASALYKSATTIFAGAGTMMNGSASQLDTTNNWRVTNIASVGFVNAAGYDYHLISSSQAIDAGSDPGVTNVWYDLEPDYEYKHKSDSVSRVLSGAGSKIDIGAFEFASVTSVGETPVIEEQVQLWNGEGSIVCATSLPHVLVSVFDMNGREVLSRSVHAGINSISTDSFSKGIYLIQANAGGQQLTQKILIR